MDPRVDEYVELARLADEYETRRKALQAELIGRKKPGAILKGFTYKLKVSDRGNLQDDKLKAKLTTAMWNRITKRTTVAALYKAEIARGRLTQAIIDECSDRTKPWLRVVK